MLKINEFTRGVAIAFQVSAEEYHNLKSAAERHAQGLGFSDYTFGDSFEEAMDEANKIHTRMEGYCKAIEQVLRLCGYDEDVHLHYRWDNVCEFYKTSLENGTDINSTKYVDSVKSIIFEGIDI